MSYEAERKAIARRIETIAHGLTSISHDGETHTVVANTAFVDVVNGQSTQRSIGAPGSNLHYYPAVVFITIITEGGKGSSAAQVIADKIIDNLTGAKFNENGVTPTSTSEMTLDFAQLGQTPHVSEKRNEAPYYRLIVNAPFVRIERK